MPTKSREREDATTTIPPDLPDQIAKRIETVVTEVRRRTVAPLSTAASGIVFGIVAAVMLEVVLVMVAIAAVRLLDSYVFAHDQWATYLVIGGIFALSGLFLWSKRSKVPTKTAG